MAIKHLHQILAAKVKEPTPLLVRNLLVKKWGAKPGYSSSNPYSDTQELRCSLSAKMVDRVVKAFVANGWKHTTDEGRTGLAHKLTYFKSDSMFIWIYPAVEMVGYKRPDYTACSVSINGPKNAKPSNLPYYD